MSRLSAEHIKCLRERPEALPYGATATYHFTRTDMAHQFAEAMRYDLSGIRTAVYESEQVVIVEYRYNEEPTCMT